MRSLAAVGRVAALGAVVAAFAPVAIGLFGGGGCTIKATFINSGQLVKGNPVQSGGVPTGSIQGVKITDDGQAGHGEARGREGAPARGHAGEDPPGLAVGEIRASRSGVWALSRVLSGASRPRAEGRQARADERDPARAGPQPGDPAR